MPLTSAHIRTLSFIVLSGVLAVVLIATLLLLGVQPRVVFKVGFLVRSWCDALGFHVPNAVGVVGTVLVAWVGIVALWLLVARFVRRAA
jgi:hypothetical protein